MLKFLIDNIDEIAEQTLEHLWITSVAMVIATFLGVLVGITLTRARKLSGPILGIVGIFQTVPSLALLGFMIPLFGIGVVPAIIALFLYALLPIVRNTYTGINNVDPFIKEAAMGMGMSPLQLLTRVELPLATPVIFAGIRTAFIINVGVATLCALIAAGGLGEFIFRGISLNNVNMIIAGAIPAALLALFFDFVLGKIQQRIHRLIKPMLIGFGVLCLATFFHFTIYYTGVNTFTGGFPSEFIHREDGLQGLRKTYALNLETREMEIGLMYQAIKEGKVDVVSGFSTDGRINAFDLVILNDDKHYFPPYYAAPIIRGPTLRKFPELLDIFNKIGDKISEQEMMQMNFQVDENHISPKRVAKKFLESKGLQTSVERTGSPDIIVGSKNFTENYILAEMFKFLIENYSNLTVGMKLGFGGTKLNFDALENGDIDVYPEYTGTALFLLLKPEREVTDSLITDKDKVFQYVQAMSQKQYDFFWGNPLGFNNTHALLMRKDQAMELSIQSISDLSRYLEKVR